LRAGDETARQEYELELRRRFPFLVWAPILYGSAITPESLRRLFPLLRDVHAMFTKRVPTGALNTWLQKILAIHPLPVRKHKPSLMTKAAFITQVATKPPVFALFVGHPGDMTPAYLRYLENQLRETYGFTGTPLRIMVRKK